MATPPDFTNGTALDASSLDKIGLWRVASLTITGQTVGAINSCFTSSFDNYRVIFTTTSMSSNSLVVWTLRASGSDDYSNYYWSTTNVGSNSGTGVNAGNPGTTAGLAYTSSTYPYGVQVVELMGPQRAQPTVFQTFDTRHDTGAFVNRFGGGVHNVSSAFDGIRFATGGATMNATITVYGYNNMA